jgi:DNA-binding Xre family transcriptional regulator
MQLNRAVSTRLMELLSEKDMTQYQLSTKSGLPRSTISNIINCTYPSMKLRIVHEVCQGLEIGINEFFSSPLFDETNLEP